MAELVLVPVVLAAILCVLDVRLGMVLTLIVGFLQDPLRKLDPDTPVYYSALVIVFAVFTLVGAMQAGALRPFGAIPGWNARLRFPILLFVLTVALQSLATVAYSGSIPLGGIGLLVYLAPFPTLILGYSYARSAGQIRVFLWLYVVLSAVMVSGVYLSWLGVDWNLLQSVGDPLVVYSLDTGEALELPSGFLRSPEVAAWHAASGVCIALMLASTRVRKDTGIVSVAIALFFIGAVMLTGRRKFLIEIAIFLPVLWFLLWRFRMATGRALYLLFAVAATGAVVIATGLADSDTREAFEAPVTRGEGSRVEEIASRIENLTIGAIPYIVEQNGFFGSGAGSASGGAQYFGGGDERVGLAAEGGLGKILAEIGVPGILVFLWFAFRLTVQVWRTLETAARGTVEEARLMIGIAAFVAANVFVFVGAHQVFSDPFILLLLGSCLGFILASHRFAGGEKIPDRRLDLRGARNRTRSSYS